MKFQVKPTDPVKIEADLLVVFGYQGEKEGVVDLSDEAKRVDSALDGLLSREALEEDMDGSVGKTVRVHTHGSVASHRVLLTGLGKPKALSVAHLQTAMAAAVRQGKRSNAKRVAIVVPQQVFPYLAPLVIGQALVEGMQLGSYVFNRHKSQKAQNKEHHIEEMIVLVSANKLEAVHTGIEVGRVVAEAVTVARDLVNEPPSVTTPTYLGDVAKKLAKKSPDISCQVLDRDAMQTLGMGALLGIARGSDEEPKFIILTYHGGGAKTVALVGKGITFDSGGLSLKPSGSMETMKLDMAGAAAILGTFHVLAELKPKATVVGLIAATENMPSGRAIKPGDIVRAMNGKTIEVLNTDAEGRVILADALSYAVKNIKPDVIIDLATLTGACMVALGEELAGLFSNHPKLASELKASAVNAGERIWELPLEDAYKQLLKSPVADIKNISGSHYGGAINAALFLSEFVPETLPWAHLDIAGPAYAEKDAPLTPVGGTGFGVRTLLEYLRSV